MVAARALENLFQPMGTSWQPKWFGLRRETPYHLRLLGTYFWSWYKVCPLPVFWTRLKMRSRRRRLSREDSSN
jgi:hypothetical protein